MQLVIWSLNRLKLFVLIFLLSIVFASGPFQQYASAHYRPWLQVNNADLFAGGGFEVGGVCDNTPTGASNYQSGQGTSDDRMGGIMTFSAFDTVSSPPSTTYLSGSSTEYAAFALGVIEGNGVYSWPSSVANPAYLRSPRGLRTWVNPANPTANPPGFDPGYLSFNNGVGAGNVGGLFEGTSRAQYCVPDYFSKRTVASPTNKANITQADFNTAGQKYYTFAGNITTDTTPININAGVNSTIFIDGNLLIRSNIQYPDPATLRIPNIPKLAVVVRGEIYIAPGVSRLDGFYIAQPNTTDPANTGRIWTCHEGTLPGKPPAISLRKFGICGNQLTINGALSARQVMFTRVYGTINGAGGAPFAPAEIINFSPEMVMNGAFFTDGSSSGASSLNVTSLVSLPPIY